MKTDNKPTLKIDDSRRLTGKNLFMNQPGALLDAWVSGIDKHQVVQAWLRCVDSLLAGVGWADTEKVYRIYEDGLSVGFAAPWDALYSATELNEMAWANACDSLLAADDHNHNKDQLQSADTPEPQALAKLRAAIADEANPALMALIAEAERQGVVFLSDDDEFSLGYGKHSVTWPIDDLPAADSLDWSAFRAIPLGLVTGTNGKSTSVRLSAQILQQAGLNCGVTSTDFIRVGPHIIDRGDYSGPGGARTLLRHQAVEAAILEVARGGLLRRGIPVPEVEAALVTNIAEDHLGQYGINTLGALTATKMMVAKAVSKQLILNADDENLVDYVTRSEAQQRSYLAGRHRGQAATAIAHEPADRRLPKQITWFALDENNPKVQQALAANTATCFVRDQQIVYVDQGQETVMTAVADIPMTLQGAAVHNICNALGAVALTKALGVDNQAIRQALVDFRSDHQDNPGRGNMFTYKGAQIILDFAHNVHSMDAMALTLRNMPAKRKMLLLCKAGDRTDQNIKDITHSAMAMQPDQVWISELPEYLRGRTLGEVPAIIGSAVNEHALAEDAIHYAENIVTAAQAIFSQLQEGDLVFIMALAQRDEIAALLQQ